MPNPDAPVITDEEDRPSAPDRIVTLEDYIDEQEEQEREAAELLPGDHDQCSYLWEYANQAVYACLTCTPAGPGREMAGFCYSCSISCHTDHDVKELWKKRGFKCDCGNSKFGGFKCTLLPDKDATNPENRYNQNFHNRFCYCKQDYNPEVEEREMIKCVACEDWFHSDCIAEPADLGAYKDFICRGCATACPLLTRYAGNGLVVANADLLAARAPQKTENQDDESADGPPAKRTRLQADPGCKVSTLKEEKRPTELFCRDGWRAQLCRCDACFVLLDDCGLRFLLDPVSEAGEKLPFPQPPLEQDEPGGEGDGEGDVDVERHDAPTGSHATANNAAAPGSAREETSLYTAGLNALQGVPRTVVANAAERMAFFKTRLNEYLAPFAREGRVVTKDDIDAFVEQLKAEHGGAE